MRTSCNITPHRDSLSLSQSFYRCSVHDSYGKSDCYLLRSHWDQTACTWIAFSCAFWNAPKQSESTIVLNTTLISTRKLSRVWSFLRHSAQFVHARIFRRSLAYDKRFVSPSPDWAVAWLVYDFLGKAASGRANYRGPRTTINCPCMEKVSEVKTLLFSRNVVDCSSTTSC